MSLYPKKYYISYGSIADKITYRTVVITGYTDLISIGAFERLNLTVPFEMGRRGEYYDHIYHVKSGYEIELAKKMQESSKEKLEARGLDTEGLFPEVIIDPNEINLLDFYKEIGYDYKKKHFNGKTLRKHILDECKKKGEIK